MLLCFWFVFTSSCVRNVACFSGLPFRYSLTIIDIQTMKLIQMNLELICYMLINYCEILCEEPSFFLSSFWIWYPVLSISLDWEPVSFVFVLCLVLHMSLDCQSLIVPSVFSDVYIIVIQNKKLNFTFGMRYKRNPKRIWIWCIFLTQIVDSEPIDLMNPCCSSFLFSGLCFLLCLSSFCVLCQMFTMTLDCPFLIAHSVVYNVYHAGGFSLIMLDQLICCPW